MPRKVLTTQPNETFKSLSGLGISNGLYLGTELRAVPNVSRNNGLHPWVKKRGNAMKPANPMRTNAVKKIIAAIVGLLCAAAWLTVILYFWFTT
jgi:hypothetical protein